MAPVSAWRYISPRSATTGAAAVCTLIRLSPDDDVYLFNVKKFLQKTLIRCNRYTFSNLNTNDPRESDEQRYIFQREYETNKD